MTMAIENWFKAIAEIAKYKLENEPEEMTYLVGQYVEFWPLNKPQYTEVGRITKAYMRQLFTYYEIQWEDTLVGTDTRYYGYKLIQW